LLDTDQFAYGVLVPVLTFVVSCLGCGLGLSAAARVRAASSRAHRGAWLAVAAVAVGGVGIWALHAAALLGLEVHGAQVRYDVPTAVAGAGVAVGLVGAALYLVDTQGRRRSALVAGGVLAGLGIVGTHHVGVAAVQLTGEIHLHPGLVAASAVLAVAGATLALWCHCATRDWRATTGAALVMGLSVSGAHYTGMAAVSVSGPGGPVLTGSDPGDLLGPFLILVVGATIVLAFVVGMWPTEEEIRAQHRLVRPVRRKDDRRRQRGLTPG
jgi:NO-binding membrane sensor protein with MHYT domain